MSRSAPRSSRAQLLTVVGVAASAGILGAGAATWFARSSGAAICPSASAGSGAVAAPRPAVDLHAFAQLVMKELGPDTAISHLNHYASTSVVVAVHDGARWESVVYQVVAGNRFVVYSKDARDACRGHDPLVLRDVPWSRLASWQADAVARFASETGLVGEVAGLGLQSDPPHLAVDVAGEVSRTYRYALPSGQFASMDDLPRPPKRQCPADPRDAHDPFTMRY